MKRMMLAFLAACLTGCADDSEPSSCGLDSQLPRSTNNTPPPVQGPIYAGSYPPYTDECWSITDPDLDVTLCNGTTHVACARSVTPMVLEAEHCWLFSDMDWNKDGTINELDGSNKICCRYPGY